MTTSYITLLLPPTRFSPLSLSLFAQELREPPAGSFDTLTPTIACPLGGGAGELLGSEVELAQLRLFTFSSELQRMSVIVRQSHSQIFMFPFPHSQVRVAPTSDPKQLHVFSKGAPETICRLCRPDSGY